MTEYRRAYLPGAFWFFTANLAEGRGNRLLAERIGELRRALSQVSSSYPFESKAVVVLPNHLHCIWSSPGGDADYSTR